MDTSHNNETTQQPNENWSSPELYLISVTEETMGLQSRAGESSLGAS